MKETILFKKDEITKEMLGDYASIDECRKILAWETGERAKMPVSKAAVHKHAIDHEWHAIQLPGKKGRYLYLISDVLEYKKNRHVGRKKSEKKRDAKELTRCDKCGKLVRYTTRGNMYSHKDPDTGKICE